VLPPVGPSALLWGLVAVQVAGLISASAVRVSEGSRRQTACYCLFLALLVLVGLATAVGVRLWPGGWLLSGTTFSVMVLIATCDFERSRRPGRWEW
jgi:hypothetical protein